MHNHNRQIAAMLALAEATRNTDRTTIPSVSYINRRQHPEYEAIQKEWKDFIRSRPKGHKNSKFVPDQKNSRQRRRDEARQVTFSILHDLG